MSDYTIDEIKCDKCPLWETSTSGAIRRSGMYGRGTGKLGLWLVGEAPGANEITYGMPFVGQAGDILSGILKEINLDEKDLWLCNSVRCRPPANRTPTAKEIKTCMEAHHKLDVPNTQTPPKLIVLLGNVALKAVLDKQKIKDNRGIIFDCEMFNCKAMATYHPAAILHGRNTALYDTLKADLIKAKEFILADEVKPPVHHRILINSLDEFNKWMDQLKVPVATDLFCDIETTGLDFFKEKIISISFTCGIENEIYSIAFLTSPKNGWWYANLDVTNVRSKLQAVLNKPINFHNGLFDIKFFWKKNYHVNFNIDTMDQHLVVDENSPHNLQYLVSIYNKENDGYKQQISEILGDEGKHSDLAPEILLDYNNNDTYNSFLLKRKFAPMIKKEGVEDFFNRLAMPLKRSLTRMSYRGIMMDREGIINKSNEYREKIKLKEEELFDKCGRKFNYSPTSKEIQTVLFKELGLPVVKRTPKGSPSTDKIALDILSKNHDAPKLITDLRYFKHMIRMYLDGNDLSEEIDPDMGMLCKLDQNDRIHGSFLSGGTISGRPSCPKPNLLNIPKNPEIRNLFIAPNGWKFIEIDYSQAELVLLAHLSGDANFIKAVASEDLHMATAKGLMRSENVDDETRRKAKGVNFLQAYGGGSAKLAANLKIPEEEAKQWMYKWNETFPGVQLYKYEQMRLWKSQGYITGLYGRKKRFPPVFTREQEGYHDRISVNYMCQNGVSETVNRSMVDIDYTLDNIFGWSLNTLYHISGIVLAVYDSILGEAPDEIVPDIKELMVEIMSLPLPKLGISLKCDVNISQRWGEKLKLQDTDFVEEFEEIR